MMFRFPFLGAYGNGVERKDTIKGIRLESLFCPIEYIPRHTNIG